ncbi:MAG: SufE family protein [Flavobacteriaceae bacterium]|nr:SufE family protein [Flavobacteriaceae bacterium]
MTIKEIQEEIIDEFSMFSDWEDKFEYLIDLGKSLDVVKQEYKTDDNLIRGCQSKVWLHAEANQEKIIFTADSDAIITKGIIALLLRVYSNQNIDSILDTETKFIDQIGLKEHLSPTRANGLLAMVKQIKIYAIAFKVKNN